MKPSYEDLERRVTWLTAEVAALRKEVATLCAEVADLRATLSEPGARRRRLTTGQLARAVGYSPETIRLMADRGEIPCTRHGRRGHRRFDLKAVQEALQKRLPDDSDESEDPEAFYRNLEPFPEKQRSELQALEEAVRKGPPPDTDKPKDREAFYEGLEPFPEKGGTGR